MSTKYFLLTKTDGNTEDNKDNQIFVLNKLCYLLPETLMSDYYRQGLYESGLIEWCKQFCTKSTSFLDIGAHTGTYTLSLSSRCKEVYSFEPQKMTYYALCGSVALSNLTNVTCLNVGVGSSEQVGKNVLNIVSNDGGGSTLHEPNGPVFRTETIEVDTLDSIAKTHSICNVGFIKMDVEENELHVLQGATEMLKQSNYPKILFECNSNNPTLFDYVKLLGYKIVQLSGVSNMFLAIFE